MVWRRIKKPLQGVAERPLNQIIIQKHYLIWNNVMTAKTILAAMTAAAMALSACMENTGGTSGAAFIDAVDEINAIYDASLVDSVLYQCGDPAEARTQKWKQEVKTARTAHSCRRQLDMDAMIELRANELAYAAAMEKNFYAIPAELRPLPEGMTIKPAPVLGAEVEAVNKDMRAAVGQLDSSERFAAVMRGYQRQNRGSWARAANAAVASYQSQYGNRLPTSSADYVFANSGYSDFTTPEQDAFWASYNEALSRNPAAWAPPAPSTASATASSTPNNTSNSNLRSDGSEITLTATTPKCVSGRKTAGGDCMSTEESVKIQKAEQARDRAAAEAEWHRRREQELDAAAARRAARGICGSGIPRPANYVPEPGSVCPM